RNIQELQSEDKAKQEAASKALIALGTPALDALKDVQKNASTCTAEEARLTAVSIQQLIVDPWTILQPNLKHPNEPVPVHSDQECKEILFRLPPGTSVFRLNSWDNGNRVTHKIRTMEGREGWVDAKACVRKACD
ncbi:MAG: hypothetical protein ACYTHN_13690, partial [Planctomycetota bacterium]